MARTPQDFMNLIKEHDIKMVDVGHEPAVPNISYHVYTSHPAESLNHLELTKFDSIFTHIKTYLITTAKIVGTTNIAAKNKQIHLAKTFCFSFIVIRLPLTSKLYNNILNKF